MVQADEFLLTRLRPLFKPSSVATALTLLQQLGEHEIISAADSSASSTTTLYSAVTGDCRSSRTHFMLNVLVGLRERVAVSTTKLIKKWCDNTASRISIEIQLRNENNNNGNKKNISRYDNDDDNDEEEFQRSVRENAVVGQDVSSDDVIEIPCLLMLCAFAVTFLPGITSVNKRNEVFSSAVRVAQAEGDLIVRDDVTLNEVIEFGLEVAGTPTWRWLPKLSSSSSSSSAPPSQFVTSFGLKVKTLLWSLSSSFSSSSSSMPFVPSSVMSDPHLLLWSNYSSTCIPDAIVLESAEEARIVLDAMMEEEENEEEDRNQQRQKQPFAIATGVVILLVAEPGNWTLDSLLRTCKSLTRRRNRLPFSIWADSHVCGELVSSLSRMGEFAMVQWTDEHFSGTPQLVPSSFSSSTHITSDDSETNIFAKKWLMQTISCPSFPAANCILDGHKKQSVITAALACMTAMNDAGTTICSDELKKFICPKEESSSKATATSSSSSSSSSGFCGCCFLGLLSFVSARLPDIVPSYPQSSLGARFISPQEKKLASRRAASLSLPPGISMSPATLFLYRLAEQIPADFFSAFWVSVLTNHLILKKKARYDAAHHARRVDENANHHYHQSQEDWIPDISVVKMNSQWNPQIAGALATTASSQQQQQQQLSSLSSTVALSSLLMNSTNMCKAFSFVLTSWCEEKTFSAQDGGCDKDDDDDSEQQRQQLEEAVGRLKSVADVIDRHRTVEVRAFQQTVTTSRVELRMIVDLIQLVRSGAMSESQLFSGLSATATRTTTQNDNDDDNNSGGDSSPSFFNVIDQSFRARQVLFQSWSTTSSFAKRNFRAAFLILQQVARVFDREAHQVVSKLRIHNNDNAAGIVDDGQHTQVQPIIILRVRSELEKVSSYYDDAVATAVKALGVKGKHFMYGSHRLQSNMKIIRSVL